jgi:predicted nucleic acid-binding protein
MKPLVYIESSVVSYLTAQPKDVITQGRVAVTAAWWEQSAQDYECVLSQYVLDEVGVGNEDKAKRRLEVIQACRVLDVDRESVEALGDELLARHALPAIARLDALHIASAALAGVDWLLTWNFKHIANARQMEAIYRVCRDNGYEPATIITPDAMLQMNSN